MVVLRSWFSTPVQNRVTVAVLTQVFLERRVCKLGALELRFWGHSHFSQADKSGSLGLRCASNMICAQHLLSFREITVGGYLCDQPPISTVDLTSLKGFCGQKHCTSVVKFSLLGEEGIYSL